MNGAFLTGGTLTDAVRRVLAGPHPRCAVAFWGSGVGSFLDPGDEHRNDLRVVCDLSMGGCHPHALRELGAPKNPSVRYHDGLHAKVYLSEAGVVIGSANASDNGLGFGAKGARLVEAATFHSADSATWTAAAEWFETIYEGAAQVDEAALERARRLFRPRRQVQAAAPSRPGSLLDMVLADPDAFENVGFVLASTSATEEERADARRSAREAGVEKAVVDEATDNDLFTDWNETDVLRWPAAFVELWMPREKLHLWGRTLRGIDPAGGNVIAKRDMRAVRSLLPQGCPDFRDAARVDAATVRALLEHGSAVFRNGRQLAAALHALDG
jgi:hypothetical protein